MRQRNARFVLTKPDGVWPSTLSRGEAEVVYLCLASEGARPKTFDELVKEARAEISRLIFKHAAATTIEKSLRYWLNLFSKNGWIQVQEET